MDKEATEPRQADCGTYLAVNQEGEIPLHIRQARARQAVMRDIYAGRLERPDRCPLCGKPPAPGDVICRHHPSYEPQDYKKGEWACRKCHYRLDLTRREQERQRQSLPSKLTPIE